jgi:hypothetical protein
MEWGSHGWIDWKTNILWYLEEHGQVQFHNEVLGLPCDDASRALTQPDLVAACEEGWLFRTGPDAVTQTTNLWAGIDWGETRSRTVLTIGGYFSSSRFSIIYTKVYRPDQTSDPKALIRDIVQTLLTFNVQAVAADVGHGWGMNADLMEKFGVGRVYPIRYMGAKAPRLKFASKFKYEWVANRSQVLGELFMDIKRRRIRFPQWSQYEPYAKDWLAVFLEFSSRMRETMYSHSPDDPDDVVHSTCYARLAAELATGQWAATDYNPYNGDVEEGMAL